MFGWAKRLASRVWGGVKKVAKTVAKAVVKVGKAVGHAVAKCWKKFSGQEDAEKAEKLLEELEERTRRRQSEFKEFMDEKSRQINETLDGINALRRQLNEKLFPRFCNLAGNFRDWSVADVNKEGNVNLRGRSVTVRSRSELMKIDFRNHPVSSNLLAVCTLGFLTRKRAKESLLEVKAESHRLGLEFRKLENEKVRVDGVLKSLRQVSKYFEGCLGIYEEVLDEVDYSVALLKTNRDLLAGEAVQGKFDVEFLPERHLLSLKAADEMTRIVFAIGSRKYVANSDKLFDLDGGDFSGLQKDRSECRRIEQTLAA